MKNLLIMALTGITLLLAACGGSGNKESKGETTDKDSIRSDAGLDSTTMAKLQPGPLAELAAFMEWQANYLLGKAGSTGIPASEFMTAERKATEEVSAEKVKGWETSLVGQGLPTELDNDNFEGNVKITKVQNMIQNWYIGVEISTKGSGVSAAPLVFCDSNGDPLFCMLSKRQSGSGMRTEWSINQLNNPKKSAEMLAEYRIMKYISKVKVVSEDDYPEYEKAAKSRRTLTEQNIAKERGQAETASGDSKQGSTEAEGARGAFELFGPVSSCTWKERYQTVKYNFGQDGKLTATDGTPASQYYMSIKYDGQGRLVSTEREDEETFCYIKTEYRYSSLGLLMERSVRASDGKQHSMLTYEPNSNFVKYNSYNDEYSGEEGGPDRTSGRITYTCTSKDSHGNWTARTCKDNRSGESWTESRTIQYY